MILNYKKIAMKRTSVFIVFLCVFGLLSAKDYLLSSPDNKIKVTISNNEIITLSVSYDGVTYLQPSSISMNLADGRTLGVNSSVRKVSTREVNTTVHPLYGINSTIKEHYIEKKIDFRNNYSLVFRAYNEGIAWRFETNIKDNIIVKSDNVEFNFADDYTVYFHPGLSEAYYREQNISDSKLRPNYSSLPILVKPTDGPNILIHESDVMDYPCLGVRSNSERSNSLIGTHSSYPKAVKPGGHNNFNLKVIEVEDYIASTNGVRTFPWRLIAFEDYEKDILNNQLVYLLASESKITDTSWIKPGRVAWDWWNAMNLTGVPFKTGFNTDTYKYFIDFASENGIEYINIDDGWSDWFDLMKTTDNLDMEEIAEYAKSKNVGIFLWCVWWTIDNQMAEALDQFQKWGIKGIKVDFMDRDDQVVVNFHERLLKEAAKRELLVNYHGAYHPTGLERTYPNNVNVEGVRGLEWNKFDAEGVSPDHDVTIPFIRMFAGTMDYTPGAMSNYNKEEWKQINDRPMSQGTRCHQLAMFVVYYGALQMLSDSPTAYEKEPDFLKFMTSIPSVWDETVPLDGKIGEHITVARKTGDIWYVGGMTNWDERDFLINLDFLDANTEYIAEIFSDGVNAGRVGSDYIISYQNVKKGDTLNINAASGGGFAIKFIKK